MSHTVSGPRVGETGLQLQLDYQVGRRKVIWLAYHRMARLNEIVRYRRLSEHIVEGGDRNV